MTRFKTLLAAALLGAACTAVLAAPATAERIDGGPIHEEFSETVDDFCDQEGLTIQVDTVVNGRFRVIERGSGDPYFSEVIRVSQVFTNPETGAFVTARENTISKDLSIERDGDILTIVVLATGNATLFDADGTAIARNPGQVRFEFVIDDNGTPDDFSDDEELSFEVIKPSTGRSDDFCEAVVGAIG
jgi:hypothetical protein